MEFKPGWLNRQFENNRKEIEQWSPAMRRAMGINNPKWLAVDEKMRIEYMQAFTLREREVMNELAEKLDLPVKRILPNALRLYQAYVLHDCDLEKLNKTLKDSRGCGIIE